MTNTSRAIVKYRNYHRWSVEEIHLLEQHMNAPYTELRKLFPHTSLSAIKGALWRHKVHRLNNRPAARAPRPTRVLADLTAARLSKGLAMKSIEGKIGLILTYYEPGHCDPSVARLHKWCDALGLELRAMPKQMEAAE